MPFALEDNFESNSRRLGALGGNFDANSLMFGRGFGEFGITLGGGSGAQAHYDRMIGRSFFGADFYQLLIIFDPIRLRIKFRWNKDGEVRKFRAAGVISI